ncbi:VTT domain-containing protein [Hyphomicrobium sp.]|uniref:VTT domain-containing protein n=1 Tax=Hyphomicrobium sp. TaxID=82 RepID=UPI0025BE1B32|nr:VTT domain-containing protein [Hyphomicrobium sp.]MCC7250277.1 VTT domain-containing protein [Hyphomicrobium sp.]
MFAGALVAAVVVPFLLFGESFGRFSQHVMTLETSRIVVITAGILLLAADVVLPVPSSIVISLMGGLIGALGATVAGTIGLSLGCALGFLLGRVFGHDFAERRMGREDFAYLAGLLNRYGAAMLAICRPVPVLAEASVIAAGVVGLPAFKTLVVTSLANLGISAAYAAIGASMQGTAGFITAFVAALAVPGLSLLAARVVRGAA